MTTPFQKAFGPAKFLSVAANQTLYVNADAITEVNPSANDSYPYQYKPSKDIFRHAVGTWYHAAQDVNVNPFEENKVYFFFNDSHKFGNLHPFSGTSPLGWKFEVRRPEGWIAYPNWGIPQGFHMSQGPHDPKFAGKLQYIKDCQVVAKFSTRTSWSDMPKSGVQDVLLKGNFYDDLWGGHEDYFDNRPFPHRHVAYLSDKVGGTGATVITTIHPDWDEFFIKYSQKLLDTGFDHHTHEIIDGRMIPAGNPPHVHNSFANMASPPDGAPTSTTLATLTWRDAADSWTDIATPLYIGFMYLFASNSTLQEGFSLGTLGTTITGTPPGTPEAYAGKEAFKNDKTKLFKKAVQTFRKTILKQGSFYVGYTNFNTGWRHTPEYMDTSFQLTKPFPTSTTKMSFNWYEKCYADALAKSPNHGILPSLHLNILKLEDPDRFIASGPMIDEFNHGAGLWNAVYGNIFSMGSSPYFNPDGMDYGLEPYFNAWIHSMNDGHIPLEDNIKKTNNILFPSIKYLDKYTSQEHVFPWASELGLYTIPIKEETIASVITSLNPSPVPIPVASPTFHPSEYLQQWFMKWVVDYTEKNGSTIGPNGTPVSDDSPAFDMVSRDPFMVKENFGETATSTFKDLEAWDLTHLLSLTIQESLDLFEQATTQEIEQIAYSLSIENGLAIDPPPNNTDGAMMKGHSQYPNLSYNTNELSLTLFTMFLLGALRENNPELGRGPQCVADLFNGGLAYAEPIFYEIRKFTSAATFQKAHVQSFYIAAPFEKNFVNFIDTQLKYNKSYTYDVFACTLVVGNAYRHNGINEFPLLYQEETTMAGYDPNLTSPAVEISGGEGTYPMGVMTTINRPLIRLVKVPYTTFSTIHVADAPPTPPFVEISAYKNVNNKLLFWLSETVGKFVDARPIVIRPGDKKLFINAYHSSQGIYGDPDSLPDTIRFSADSKIKRYERFRIDKHPSKYTDFANGYKSLAEGHDDLVDTLIPNKKYYYIFRSVDQHDYISNPTPIYQVELVHNSGATYPVIKVVDLKPAIIKVKQKAGRKYVYIAPTFEQSIMKIDKTKTNAANDTPYFAGSTLGGSSLPHKFKLRFTSKTSCKKFDLNINFSHEHDDNPGVNYLWNNEKLCYEYVNKPGENDEGKSNPAAGSIPPFVITPEPPLKKCDAAESAGSINVDTVLTQEQTNTLNEDSY